MGKRKLTGEPTQSKRPVFRLAHTPGTRNSIPLVTTLRKGSSGRRGCRREQLPPCPPALPTEPQVPSNETSLDAPFPNTDDMDFFNDTTPFITPNATNPKRVQTNTTSVSAHKYI